MRDLLINKYDFLKHSVYNPYCYKKCPTKGWLYNVPDGWLGLAHYASESFYNLVNKHSLQGFFRLNYIGPRAGRLEILFDGISSNSYKEFNEIADQVCEASKTTCCICGNQAQIAIGINKLPYCENCINKFKNYPV